MKLNKKQRTRLLEWIAEGLESGEINKRAAKQKPPFNVTRQQVDHYRKTREVDLQTLKQTDEHSALSSGLALRAERVKLLQDLAARMSDDLLNKNLLWLDQAKGIGSQENYERIDYQEFNSAEVAQLRGVLDDIAQEVNERIKKHEVTGKDGGPIIPFDLEAWKKDRSERLANVQKLEE